MFYKRKGMPEVDEIVLCKVTSLFPNSVFVELMEYNRQGMVHISEISPGRIRNLRDFVSIGREIVCKVLRIDQEKGHIDLSLRRVNSNQHKAKLDEIKQELKAESLIKNLSKKLKLPAEKLYQQLSEKIFKEYSHLYLCFRGIADGQADLEKLGVEKKTALEVTVAVLEKFKPEKIFLKGEIRLQTYSSEGLDKIKNTLAEIGKISESLSLSYLGAGRYRLTIEDSDYKPAEKKLKKVEEILEKFTDKLSTAEFKRTDE